jgi:hypothetical protein
MTDQSGLSFRALKLKPLKCTQILRFTPQSMTQYPVSQYSVLLLILLHISLAKFCVIDVICHYAYLFKVEKVLMRFFVNVFLYFFFHCFILKILSGL